MDNEKISDLINSIAQGKALESETIFNELAMARVQDRMAEYRQEVASSMFTTPTEE